MLRGKFITFEGIDGTGKSTQVKELAKRLGTGSVFITKEPGDANCGSNIGAGIRQLLFHEPTAKNMYPGVADLLFLADHIQTSGDVERKVSEGHHVISDRYADSQFAYGASKTKQAPEWIMDLYRTHYGTKPDAIVLLLVRGEGDREDREDISWALKRAKGRSGAEAGKQEGKPWNDIEEQRTIQNAYLTNLQDNPNTIIISITENMTTNQVADVIYFSINKKLFS